MSFVLEILGKLTDDELVASAKEILNWHSTGILSGGVLRHYAKQLSDNGVPSAHSLNIVEKYVLETCARKWVESASSTTKVSDAEAQYDLILCGCETYYTHLVGVISSAYGITLREASGALRGVAPLSIIRGNLYAISVESKALEERGYTTMIKKVV